MKLSWDFKKGTLVRFAGPGGVPHGCMTECFWLPGDDTAKQVLTEASLCALLEYKPGLYANGAQI